MHSSNICIFYFIVGFTLSLQWQLILILNCIYEFIGFFDVALLK